MSSPSVVQIRVPAGPILLYILTGVITLQLLVNFLAQTARTITWISRAALPEETSCSSCKSGVVERSIDSEQHKGRK